MPWYTGKYHGIENSPNHTKSWRYLPYQYQFIPDHSDHCTLEKELYTQFEANRAQNKLVSIHWFRRHAKIIFELQHGLENSHLWVFSRGWFYGFRARYHISRRRITKVAQKTPEEVFAAVNSWLKFIRRNSQPYNGPMPAGGDFSRWPISRRSTDFLQIACRGSSPPIPDHIKTPPYHRFDLELIVNLDETPMPFEICDGYTYSSTGAKTVGAKSQRSGWNLRQMTVIPYITADGIDHFKWLVIFHGTPTDMGGRNLKNEEEYYAKDIIVKFNDTAWNNEVLLVDWIETELTQYAAGREVLLVMDSVQFHRTERVLSLIKNINAICAEVPSGMTSFVQPLDTHINRLMKDWVRLEIDIYTIEKEDEWFSNPINLTKTPFTWTVSEKRIMMTHVLSKVKKRLHTEHKHVIIRSFKQCGISIAADGSEDHLIRIKDVPDSVINFNEWEFAPKLTNKAHEPVSKLEDDEELVLENEAVETSQPPPGLGLKKPHLVQICKDHNLRYGGTIRDLMARINGAKIYLSLYNRASRDN